MNASRSAIQWWPRKHGVGVAPHPRAEGGWWTGEQGFEDIAIAYRKLVRLLKMVEGQKILLAMNAEEDLVARSSQGSPCFRTVIIIELAAPDVAPHICALAKTQNYVSTFNIIVLHELPNVAADIYS